MTTIRTVTPRITHGQAVVGRPGPAAIAALHYGGHAVPYGEGGGMVDQRVDPSFDEDRRAWARPHPEGDPWHEYWDPDAEPDVVDRRARRARVYAVTYLIAAPIVIVLSLIFGAPYGALSGLVASLFAVVRIRTLGERHKGFLIAALTLSLVWAVALTVRVVPYLHGQKALALAAGDCFTRSGTGADDGFLTTAPTLVPCTRPHDAEVVGTASAVDKASADPSRYPTRAVLSGLAATGCHSISRAYTLDPLSLPPGARLHWYLPTRSQWYSDIVCFVATDRPTLTRSVREDATDVNDYQLDFLVATGDFEDAVATLDALGPHPSWARLRPALAAAADAHTVIRSRLMIKPWPDPVKPDLERLIDGLEAADPFWREAAEATNPDAALALVAQAKAKADPAAQAAVRRELGLPTTQGDSAHTD